MSFINEELGQQYQMNNSSLMELKCTSIVTHNACMYELQELIKSTESISRELPFNKQFMYIPSISNVEMIQGDEMSTMMNMMNTVTQISPQNPSIIKIDYSLDDGQKKPVELKTIPYRRRPEILRTFQEGQTVVQSNQIFDGLYNLSDFLFQNKNDADEKDDKKMEAYLEKLLEAFNKGMILQFISHFLTHSLVQFVKINNIKPIDIDIQNFLLMRQGNVMRFIYLLSYSQFVKELDKRLSDKSQPKFDYMEFREQLCVTKKGSSVHLSKRVVDLLEELNAGLVETLLSGNERKEHKEQKNNFSKIVFCKDQKTGMVPIEKALLSIEQRRRFNSFVVWHNQILTVFENGEEFKKNLKDLLDKEEKQHAFVEFFDEFLQCILVQSSSDRNEQLKKNISNLSLVKIECELYQTQQQPQQQQQQQQQQVQPNQQQQQKVQGDNRVVATSTPTTNNMGVLKSDRGQTEMMNHSPNKLETISEQGRRLKISLNINEIEQVSSEKKDNNPIMTYKRFLIDVSHEMNSCSIKLFISQKQGHEMSVTFDMTDEVLYCIQILNNAIPDVTICIDEARRVYFTVNFQIGPQMPFILRAVQALDMLSIVGIIFCDFFYTTLQSTKSSRDHSKYKLVQYEVQHTVLGYKQRMSRFEESLLGKAAK